MKICLFSKVVLAVAICFAAPLMAASKDDAAKKDRGNIQGTWKVVAMEANGQHAPPEIVAALRFIFKGDKLTVSPGEPGFTNYTFRLDPTSKPASYDQIHADGENKGKSDKGIYYLEGDSLKICLGNDKRPKELTSQSAGMYVLKREKLKP